MGGHSGNGIDLKQLPGPCGLSHHINPAPHLTADRCKSRQRQFRQRGLFLGGQVRRTGKARFFGVIFGVEIVEIAGHVNSDAGQCSVAEDRDRVFRPRDKLLGHHIGTKCAGVTVGGLELSSVAGPAHTQRRTLKRRFHKNRAQCLNHRLPIRLRRQLLKGGCGQAQPLPQPLGADFVHGQRRRHEIAAAIGQLHELE